MRISALECFRQEFDFAITSVKVLENIKLLAESKQTPKGVSAG
jgi:hypothetical protein